MKQYDKLNKFIDYLIAEIHDLTTTGDCVDMHCYSRLRNEYWEKFNEQIKQEIFML